MKHPRTAGRPPGTAGRKRDAILEHLRRRILSGDLPPGARVPTREELVRRFRASMGTVQRALERLSRDGFAVSRGPAGTFVADAPPHLSNYGLVFELRPTQQCPWSRFWTALLREAECTFSTDACRFTPYYLSGGDPAGEDYRELLGDFESHRLAGIIFAGPPYVVSGSPLVRQPGVPRVCLHDAAIYGLPGVYPDLESLLRRALEYLRDRHRRRLAFIALSSNSNWERETQAVRLAAEMGLDLPAFRVQSCNFGNFRAAANVAHLLAALPPATRPDGLILADEHLVEPVAAGLVAAGLRVPQDLEVVAHGNFPLANPDVLPFRRLGFDCRRLLQTCLDVLQRQRAGRRVAMATRLPAVFDAEINDPFGAGSGLHEVTALRRPASPPASR